MLFPSIENCFEDAVDYTGGGPWDGKRSSPQYCQDECQSTTGCNYWVYKKSTKHCYLRFSKRLKKIGNNDIVSGPKTCKGEQIHKVYLKVFLFHIHLHSKI